MKLARFLFLAILPILPAVASAANKPMFTVEVVKAISTSAAFGHSELLRVKMPDGAQQSLWCRTGMHSCLHLVTGSYWAERENDDIWIYCSYANQEGWNEKGMSDSQRKANHVIEKVKYQLVGKWSGDVTPEKTSEAKPAAKPAPGAEPKPAPRS